MPKSKNVFRVILCLKGLLHKVKGDVMMINSFDLLCGTGGLAIELQQLVLIIKR